MTIKSVAQMIVACALIGASLSLILRDFSAMTYVQQGVAALVSIAFALMGMVMLNNVFVKKRDEPDA